MPPKKGKKAQQKPATKNDFNIEAGGLGEESKEEVKTTTPVRKESEPSTKSSIDKISDMTQPSSTYSGKS